MAFTAEQKREWRKRPEVKAKQAEHQRRHYEKLAAKHKLPVYWVKRFRLKLSSTSACDAIAAHERKALATPPQYSVIGRAIFPRQEKPCPVCGELTHLVACKPCKYKYQRRIGQRRDCKVTRNRRARERYAEDEVYRFDKKLSVAVRQGSHRSWCWEWLGYSKQELEEHLEATIPDGYTLRDYDEARLELDHIKARSKFEHTIEGQWKAWRLSNLQLLPRLDNLNKADQ